MSYLSQMDAYDNNLKKEEKREPVQNADCILVLDFY